MKYLLTLVALLVLYPAFSQPGMPECGFYGTKTLEERNALFPFNKAKKVVLVSFPCITHLCFYNNSIDSAMVEFNAIKRLDFNLGEDHETTYLIKEEVIISQHEVNKLSNLLVNYIFKEEPNRKIDLYAESLCYSPRNALLFYDGNDTLICCYEICFECGHGVIWPDPDKLYNADIVNNCGGAYRLLKQIFSENGITYGINEQ
jgi:hypothetical protein